MQIIFYLQCYTRFGENLFVEIDAKSYAMEYVAHGTWRCVLTMESDTMKGYRYYIDDSHQSIYYEWRRLYRDLPTIHGNKLQIYDTFERFPLYEPFRSLPFEKLYCKHDNVKPTKILTDGDCLLRVDMPGLLPQEGVGLLGSDILLGDWNATRFLKLDYREDSQWEIVIPNAKALQGCEYKLFVYNEVNGSIVRWEDGFNRYMPFMEGVTILSLSPKQKLSWHGAGVAIPLFSLRSELSWGIGEYVDLHLMIDWALQTGQKVIQLLPINDTTTWFDDRDSYPYKSNSIYALNPLYIRPSAIDGCNIDSLKIYESERKALNSEKTLDYKAVVALKWRCFQDIYKNQWELFLESKSFESYYNRHREWLLPYAVYSCVRDKFHTANFSEWYKWEHYDALQVIAYANAHRFEVGFYYFLQYHAEKQLLAACKYAHSHGITLKGDLPIGISGNSVEAWMQPELFHMDMQCGAPPDAFSEVGQNWFFPTYNWQAMAADGYQWWKGRFTRMEQFFDAFRIDHILGFFRIWEIPKEDIIGLCGHFNPALPYSIEELNNYGITGDLKRYTQPYITTKILNDFFDEKSSWVVSHFLEKEEYQNYHFKLGFETQIALQDYFQSKVGYQRKKKY